jgi:hypothetical protein
MKVTLAKYGGLGGPRPAPRVVDADCLAPAEAAELVGLVNAAKAAGSAKGDEPRQGADLMSYTITVEENGAPTLLHQAHTNMTPAFKALRNWLEEHPKEK